MAQIHQTCRERIGISRKYQNATATLWTEVLQPITEVMFDQTGEAFLEPEVGRVQEQFCWYFWLSLDRII